MKNSILFSVLMLVSASSALAKGDCRLKLIPTYNVGEFADVNTAQTAYEITETLSDRRHGFRISNDVDAPYTLQYTITANVSDQRNVQTAYSVQFNKAGSTYQISASGSNNGTARKEKKQAKLYHQTVSALISALPACPER